MLLHIYNMHTLDYTIDGREHYWEYVFCYGQSWGYKFKFIINLENIILDVNYFHCECLLSIIFNDITILLVSLGDIVNKKWHYSMYPTNLCFYCQSYRKRM